MIVVDACCISLMGDSWQGFDGKLEVDAQVTFYDENKNVLGQVRGDFVFKSDKSLSLKDAENAIEEMFRRSV